MYKGVINEPTEVKANEPIPFITIYNDGKCTDIENDGMTKLITPNYDYIVSANAVLTNVPRNTHFEIQLYVGDEKIPNAIAAAVSVSGTMEFTLNIFDVLHAKLAENADGCSCLNVRTNEDCVIKAGVFCVA